MCKTCRKCKRTLEYKEFYKNVQQKDGYNIYCKECQKAMYGKKNRERALQYYYDNREEKLAAVKEYNMKHKMAKQKYQKEYYQKNKEWLYEANIQYKKKFMGEYFRIRQNIRREADRQGDLTPEEWKRIVEVFDHCCAYCGCPLEEITLDHMIPVSKGGLTTADNVVPACRSCNSSKGNKNLEDWLNEKERV